MAIKDIIAIPPTEWTKTQHRRLDACLTALAHQPERWYSYQDWGPGRAVRYMAERGIEFVPRPDRRPRGQSYYEGCGCNVAHWRVLAANTDAEG